MEQNHTASFAYRSERLYHSPECIVPNSRHGDSQHGGAELSIVLVRLETTLVAVAEADGLELGGRELLLDAVHDLNSQKRAGGRAEDEPSLAQLGQRAHRIPDDLLGHFVIDWHPCNRGEREEEQRTL